jgi:DNA-binding CsgD family transcriptional regulator
VFGTSAADALHVGLGIPYPISTAFYAIVLAIVFTAWYRSEKTLSIHSIHTRRREKFYWATVLATFALGTAAADMTATAMHLGFFTSGVMFTVLIAVPAAAVFGSRGRAADARVLLAEALDRYEAIGANWYAARANASIRSFGARRGRRGSRERALTGWESLTKSERAVAELVAEGLTNREVGKRLFISPHTVNSHLRHAFQKLDVSTRAALASKLSRAQAR